MGKRSRELDNANGQPHLPRKQKKNGGNLPLTQVTNGETPEKKRKFETPDNFTSQHETFFKENGIQIEDSQTELDSRPEVRPVIAFHDLPPHCRNFPTLQKFTAPTPIQSAAWPFLISQRDLIGIAETGSGKTLAFGLPLVVRLSQSKKKSSLRAVILTPTRELAIQVFEQIKQLADGSRQRVVCVYGGVSKDPQRGELRKATVVVGTPGRLKDFLNEGSVSFDKVRYLVLDEADRMLDKGFEEDIKMMVECMPSSEQRQTAMFTATWPRSIRELASSFMRDPVKITIGEDRPDGELRANTRISQTVEVIDQYAKQSRLVEILNENQAGSRRDGKILVFCLYKKEATRIENFLRSRGFKVAGIHGDMNQRDRLNSLDQFKSGSMSILVATDVAARGLDIPAVALVLNLTMSLTAEDYVHRIGRTGRAGASGRAITLFTEADKALSGPLINVLKAAKQPVPEKLLQFGTTVKKKGHEAYGSFYKDTTDAKAATKIKFED